MGSSYTPKMTSELLRSYSEAALRNADELLVEASLLYDHGHSARAYFLAVACIEEGGKALLAFDSQKRNLSDPAVCIKLKTSMENHAQKITYSIMRWALKSVDLQEALEKASDLIFDLQHGREPSMYTELRTDPDRVCMPREVARATAARDCIRLAKNSLAYANRHVREKTPVKSTSAQDKLLTMKSGKFQDMLSTADFWWYYISCMEAGQEEIAEAVLGYERDHVKNGTSFRPSQ